MVDFPVYLIIQSNTKFATIGFIHSFLFQVVTKLAGMEEDAELHYKNKEEQVTTNHSHTF